MAVIFSAILCGVWALERIVDAVTDTLEDWG